MPEIEACGINKDKAQRYTNVARMTDERSHECISIYDRKIVVLDHRHRRVVHGPIQYLPEDGEPYVIINVSTRSDRTDLRWMLRSVFNQLQNETSYEFERSKDLARLVTQSFSDDRIDLRFVSHIRVDGREQDRLGLFGLGKQVKTVYCV